MQRILNFLTLFKRERRPGDLVYAVVSFVMALMLVPMLPSQAKFLDHGDFVAQPGFWPLVAVVMMVVFGAAQLVMTFTAPKLPGRWQEVWFWVRSLEYVFWFTMYVALVPMLGYLPSTVIFALLMVFRLGYRSRGAFAAAAGLGVLIVVIFKAGLGVHIPAGEIYQYLPPSLRTVFIVYL